MEREWDIEVYRNKFEPEEQWELKRKFMESHKNLPKDRVVCLAQVLVNVEFLGAKYPNEIMKKVAEMSKEIIIEFRERQRTRLQRTFVGAAEAASVKVRGVQTATQFVSETAGTKVIESTNTKPVATSSLSKNTMKRKMNLSNLSTGNTKFEEAPSKKRKKEKKAKELQLVNDVKPADNTDDDCLITWDSSNMDRHLLLTKPSAAKVQKKKEKATTVTPRLAQFVLISREKMENMRQAPNFRQIIETSAHFSQVKLNITRTLLADETTWEFGLQLFGKDVAFVQETYSTKKQEKRALNKLFEKAYAILQKTHYQIIITDEHFISVPHFLTYVEDFRQVNTGEKVITTITKDTMRSNKKSISNLSSDAAAAPPVKSSVAEKMMKMMGWAEGMGLGVEKQGIVEPIRADVVVGREGIGFTGDSIDSKSFGNLIRRYLRNYMHNGSIDNLVFSNEFSSDQRKVIHDVARKLSLTTKSVGKHFNRQLTVRRSPCTFQPLVELVNQLKESNGSDALFEKVRLIPPTENTSYD